MIDKHIQKAPIKYIKQMKDIHLISKHRVTGITGRNFSSYIQTLSSNRLNVRRNFLRWLDAGYKKKHSLRACWYSFSNSHYAKIYFGPPWQSTVASHAGVFRRARNEIRTPLKTPAWEAKSTAAVSYFSHLSRDFYTLMSFEIRGKYEVRWCELLLGLRVNKNKRSFEFQSYSLCFQNKELSNEQTLKKLKSISYSRWFVVLIPTSYQQELALQSFSAGSSLI